MKHIIYYQFLSSLRDRISIFWNLAFPIILGTLFFVSFGRTNEREWETIPVAVVKEEENTGFTYFLEAFQEQEDSAIQVTEMQEEEALEALDSGEVEGIYYIRQEPVLTIRSSSLNSSVLEGILSSYLKNEIIYKDIFSSGVSPDLMSEALGEMTGEESFIKEVSLGGESLDSNMSYFFALIAMACLFGCFLGMSGVMCLQANISTLGARRSVTPAKKSHMILALFLVNFVIVYICLMILLVYLNFVLGIKLGNQWGGMMLTCFFGDMIGVCMGIAIGSIGKLPMPAKIGINVGVSMTLSFMSGLMIGNMKHIIDSSCPIINRLNPAAVISDAFYCLCIYNDPIRYRNDLLILALFSIGLLILSYCAIRRNRYDSI